MSDQEKLTINDEEVTPQKLQEIKENLPPNEKLVEVDKNAYRKLERMNG